MTGLLSIAPLAESVSVREQSATVTGVSVQSIASLLFRLPALNKMWATGQFDVEALLSMSDEVVNAVLAAGVKGLDEANAANLALDEKAELLGAILRVTMPRGPRPFVESLTKLMGSVSETSAKAQATKSLSRSKR